MGARRRVDELGAACALEVGSFPALAWARALKAQNITARRELTDRTIPGGWQAYAYGKVLEGFHDHRYDDEDHQKGRNLVKHPIEFMAFFIGVRCEGPDAAGHVSMGCREDENEQ